MENILILNFENDTGRNSTERKYFSSLKEILKAKNEIQIEYKQFKNNLFISNGTDIVFAVCDNDTKIQNMEIKEFIDIKLKNLKTMKDKRKYFKKKGGEETKNSEEYIFLLPPKGMAFEYFLCFHISNELSLVKNEIKTELGKFLGFEYLKNNNYKNIEKILKENNHENIKEKFAKNLVKYNNHGFLGYDEFLKQILTKI